MSPIHQEIVERKMRLLEGYLRDLSNFKKYNLQKYLDDVILQRAVERTLELSIQCMLDIGSHILAQHFQISPDEYAQIPYWLNKKKILSPVLSRNLMNAARFRNLLIHEYATVDQSKVFQYVRHGAKDLQAFMKSILRFLETI